MKKNVKVFCSGCKKEIKPKSKYRMMMITSFILGPLGLLKTPFVYHPECYKKKSKREYYEKMKPFKASFFDIKANIASLKVPIEGETNFNKNEFTWIIVSLIGLSIFTNVTVLYIIMTSLNYNNIGELISFNILFNIFLIILMFLYRLPILKARKIRKLLD